MKKTIYILWAIMIFCLIHTSCETQSPGEPGVWLNYYAFVDEEGRDFFDNNPDYDFEDLRICPSQISEECQLQNINLMMGDGYYYKVDGFHVLGTYPFRIGPVYWDFGNGDVDTLWNDWNPSSVTAEDAYFKLKSYEHIYNGKVIEKWDFHDSQDVRDWMNGNNVGGDKLLLERAEGRGFENIKIVYIQKRPQPE